MAYGVPRVDRKVYAAPILDVTLLSQSGPSNATVWTFQIFNSGSDAALDAQLDFLTLAQTAGPACTPILLTAFPVAAGTIAPNASGNASTTINFTGCLSDALFTVDAGASSNAGSFTDSVRLTDVSMLTAPAPVPEPASMTLLGLGLAGLGASRWRQRRNR